MLHASPFAPGRVVGLKRVLLLSTRFEPWSKARIAARHPAFMGGIVVADASGRHAGAANGWTFTYSLSSHDTGGKVKVFTVQPPTLLLSDAVGGDEGTVHS